MKLVKVNILWVTGLLLWGGTAVAQQIDSSIQDKQKALEAYKLQTEQVLKELEQLKLQRTREKLVHYKPAPLPGEEEVVHSAYLLSYNNEHEQANWVLHLVTKDILFGVTGRTNDFRMDPLLKCGSADSADYWNSGYDRGHLAPSADFRWSKSALSESYYYSNMSPQKPEFNRGSWAKLEMQVREWAVENEEVIVLTGPVLNDSLPKIPQGSERVSIPRAYYKIVLLANVPHPKAVAFLMPNEDFTFKPFDYIVTIDSIEQLTGIDFFYALDDSLENIVEAMKNPADWKLKYDAAQVLENFTFTEKQIPTSQARYFIGAECTICGKVIAGRYNMNGKSNPTYLNFDKPFPDTPFTVVIFGKDRMNFGFEPEIYLKDKFVCVFGKVGEYNGTPQMIISDESQISLPGFQE